MVAATEPALHTHQTHNSRLRKCDFPGIAREDKSSDPRNTD